MRTSPCHNPTNYHSTKTTHSCSIPAKIGTAVFALHQLVNAACTVSLEPNGRFLGGDRGKNDAAATDGAARTDAGSAPDSALQPRPDGGTILDAADDTFEADDAADCHGEPVEPCDDAGPDAADAADACHAEPVEACDAGPQDVSPVIPDSADVIPDSGPEPPDTEGTPDAEPDAAPDATQPPVCPPQPCGVGQGICAKQGETIFDEQCNPTGCSAVAGDPTETPERSCDGQDNNCDGATDETFANQGQPCAAGIGECRRQGEMVCASPIGVVCNAQPAAPAENEACDNADNDCDTITDEACPCREGVGACQHDGTIQENGACSAFAGEPTEELCNGADDDCDTETDETFPEEGPCSTGIGDCERPGQIVCDPTKNPTVFCDAEPGQPSPEICDGQDNDCDDVTDPENSQECAPLYQDQDADTYGTGNPRCLCDPEEQFTAERTGDCNDNNENINPEMPETPVNLIDDDCNGWTDETPAGMQVRCQPEGRILRSDQPSYGCINNEMLSVPYGERTLEGTIAGSTTILPFRDIGGNWGRTDVVLLRPLNPLPNFTVTAWGGDQNNVWENLGAREGACPADVPPLAPAADRQKSCFSAEHSLVNTAVTHARFVINAW